MWSNVVAEPDGALSSGRRDSAELALRVPGGRTAGRPPLAGQRSATPCGTGSGAASRHEEAREGARNQPPPASSRTSAGLRVLALAGAIRLCEEWSDKPCGMILRPEANRGGIR